MHLYLHYYIGRDSLKYHNQQRFTTKDRDQDGWPYNCAVLRQGAWWYRDCAQSNLNGNYSVRGNNWEGVMWYGYPSSDYMKSTTMMVKCHQS